MFTMFFFFNDTATTEIYTLSLHDALPILHHQDVVGDLGHHTEIVGDEHDRGAEVALQVHDQIEDLRLHRHVERSEEHTSELQSRQYLVCRLLLEKKKIITFVRYIHVL